MYCVCAACGVLFGVHTTLYPKWMIHSLCVHDERESVFWNHHTATYIFEPNVSHGICAFGSAVTFLLQLIFWSLSLFGLMYGGIFHSFATALFHTTESWNGWLAGWLTISNGLFMCSLNSSRISYMWLNYVFSVFVWPNEQHTAMISGIPFANRSRIHARTISVLHRKRRKISFKVENLHFT